jgi:hypothetical protein
MHYEDQARRINLMSGLLLGAVVGVGIGLMAGPLDIELPRRRRSRRQRLARQWKELRDSAQESVGATLGTGSRRWR